MSERAVIGFPRWTELLSLAGGSWAAAYPLANLKTLPLSRVARSADATVASTQLTATLSPARPVRLVGLCRHNLSLAARSRLRLYQDGGLVTLLLDTGWTDVWPRVYPLGAVAYEDVHFWTQTYAAEDLAGYPWHLIVWLDRVYYTAAVLLELDDETNAAGHVQAGLLEVAQGWQVSVNFRFGAGLGWELRSEPERAEGGVEWTERRPAPRRFAGEIDYLPEDEALANGWEAIRRYDRVVPWLLVPRPASPEQYVREAFLARWAEPGLLSFAAPRRRSLPLSMVEVIG